MWKRLKGLMFRTSIGRDEGLLLTPCNGVHTFFMRFEIDVMFLNSDLEVVRLCERLRPNRLGVFCPGAAAVLECRAGFIAANHISLNARLGILNNGTGVISNRATSHFNV